MSRRSKRWASHPCRRGSRAHARSAHRRRRCRIDACTGPRFALVPLIVPTSTIGDRIHIITEGPCSISHVTHRATASHGQRLAVLHAIPPVCISRESEPRPPFPKFLLLETRAAQRIPRTFPFSTSEQRANSGRWLQRGASGRRGNRVGMDVSTTLPVVRGTTSGATDVRRSYTYAYRRARVKRLNGE